MAGNAPGGASSPRLASMSDVAARAGVSVMTVSNVINQPHVVSERTRAKVGQPCSNSVHRNNLVARSLRLAIPRQIGYALSARQHRGDEYMEAFCTIWPAPAAQGRNLTLIPEEQQGAGLGALRRSVLRQVRGRLCHQRRRPRRGPTGESSTVATSRSSPTARPPHGERSRGAGSTGTPGAESRWPSTIL